MNRTQLSVFILKNPSIIPTLLIIDEPKYIYNRIKFNRMNYAEQKIYNEKLKIRKTTYGFGESICFINIPKKLLNELKEEGVEVVALKL